jgi:uncharacterized protein (TIGR00255 family)
MPAIVASMTGFAAAQSATAAGTLTAEIRSVNSRFLDLSLRCGDELRAAEAAVRERIAAKLARGKVECRLWLQRDAAAGAPQLNPIALAQLATLATQVQATLPQVAPLRLADALAWPGVVETPQTDADQWVQAALSAVDAALDGVLATRAREGEALRLLLLERCAAIDAVVAAVRARAPELLAQVERKLNERLTSALVAPLAAGGVLSKEEIAERIRQEVTLYGLRADVEEELQRLSTHVTEVRRVLAAGGAVGRRLDFLMQELNREANTLGSKAAAIEMTQAAVDLKLAIEQMREQIQNLE